MPLTRLTQKLYPTGWTISTFTTTYPMSMSDLSWESQVETRTRWRVCRQCGVPTADKSRNKCEGCGSILPIDYVYSKEVPRR